MDSLAEMISGTKRHAVSRVAFAVALAVSVLLSILSSSACSNSVPSPTPTPSPMPSPAPSPTPPVFTSGTSMGSPDAPITIVNYSDFQCHLCQEFALTNEKELIKAYVETGKVRLIYKHFIVWGNESMQAAMASEYAAEQNKFWPYHDLLMQTRASFGEEVLTTAKLESLAQQAGLDMAGFSAALESEKYREKITQDDAEGSAAGVTGTPTFFVSDGKRVGEATGNAPFEKFQEVIEGMLSSSANQ